MRAFEQLADGFAAEALKVHGQGDENEADREAVSYLVAAGYDPRGYVRFLQRVAPTQANRGLMPTHPGIPQRVQRIESEITKAGNPAGQTNAERFMRATAALRPQS